MIINGQQVNDAITPQCISPPMKNQ